MKTTIDLSDDLATKARQLAKKRGVTFRSVIEEGIRLSLEKESARSKFQLSDKSVGGDGLQEEFRDKSWAEIREAAYGGKYA